MSYCRSLCRFPCPPSFLPQKCASPHPTFVLAPTITSPSLATNTLEHTNIQPQPIDPPKNFPSMTNPPDARRQPVVCVFCGASSGTSPVHLEAARTLAHALHKSNIKLVYGGGTVGLMGEVARTLVSLSGPSSVHGTHHYPHTPQSSPTNTPRTQASYPRPSSSTNRTTTPPTPSPIK